MADVVARQQKMITVFLGILTTIVVLAVFKTQSDVVLPIVIAMLLARLFEPSIRWLSGKGIPKGIGLLVTLVGAGALLASIALVLGLCAQQVAAVLPNYTDKADAMLQGAAESVRSLMAKVGADTGQLDMSHGIDPDTIISVLTAGFGGALGFLSNAILILFLMLMIIGGSQSIAKGVEKGYGPQRLAKGQEFMQTVDKKVQQFLVSQTIVNLITGIVTYIILAAFGLDLAFVFAVLTFFLSYIPAIGGLVSQLLPILMAFLQFDSGGKIGAMVAVLLVGNLLIDRVVGPKIMGKSLSMSPLVVFVAFILFTWLWGTIGALIAVPATAIIKVAFEKSANLKPVAYMMEE